MKKIIIIILAIVFILIIGTVYYSVFRVNKTDNDFTKKDIIKSDGVGVIATIVKKDDLIKTIKTTASFEAFHKIVIKSQVSSVVDEVFIEDGLQVKKGDKLIVCDNKQLYNLMLKTKSDFVKSISELILELESSEFKVELKKWRNYILKITDEKNIPPYPKPKTDKMAIILSRLNVQSTYNSLKESELKLSYATITAPFDGIISGVEVHTGDFVSTGSKLCKLTDLLQLRLKINILEEDISDIEIGSTVFINNSREDTIKINYLLPNIDEDHRTGTAIASYNNSDFLYRDGQNIQVEVVKNIYKDRIIVPRKALLNRNERTLVFIVKSGITQWRYVNIGESNSDFLEITKGVSVGDTVVIGGHYSLAHNIKVKIIKLIK